MNNATYYHAETRRMVTAEEFADLKRAEPANFRAAPRRYRFTGSVEGSILDGDEEMMNGGL